MVQSTHAQCRAAQNAFLWQCCHPVVLVAQVHAHVFCELVALCKSSYFSNVDSMPLQPYPPLGTAVPSGQWVRAMGIPNGYICGVCPHLPPTLLGHGVESGQSGTLWHFPQCSAVAAAALCGPPWPSTPHPPALLVQTKGHGVHIGHPNPTQQPRHIYWPQYVLCSNQFFCMGTNCPKLQNFLDGGGAPEPPRRQAGSRH